MKTLFYDHHFIGMHWVWWLIIIAIVLLVAFNIIPYRTRTDPKEDALDILKNASLAARSSGRNSRKESRF